MLRSRGGAVEWTRRGYRRQGHVEEARAMIFQVYFRDAVNGMFSLGPFSSDGYEDDYKRLREDFVSFLNEGKPLGGAYRAKYLRAWEREPEDAEMMLRFNEVIGIGNGDRPHYSDR
jgi:hypothetical protein